MSTMAAMATPGLISARQRVRQYAARALARLRAQEALKGLAVTLTISIWLLTLLIFTDRLFSLSKVGINIWIIWGGVTVLGIPYILWRCYAPRIHENMAAVLADDRLGLHARICTALTLDLNDPAGAEFSEAFFAEALQRLNALDVERAFPIKAPRGLILLLLPLAAAGMLYKFMPYQDKLGLEAAREQKRKAEAAQKAAATKLEGKLEDLKKQITDHSDEKGGQYKVQQLIQDADKIAKDLKEGKRNPDEAMVSIGQIKQKIEEEKEKLTQGKDFIERLEKLKAQDLNLEQSDMTREVSEALKMGDPGEAARRLRQLANKVKNDILDNPDKSEEQKQKELDKLKREVEKLADALAEDEALRQNLQDVAQKLSPEELQKLQEEMKKFENQNKTKNSDVNKQRGNDIEQKIEDVAEELERLEEDKDVKLSEEEEKEMETLENVEEGLDQAQEEIANEGREGQEGEQAQQGQGQQGKSQASGNKQRSGAKPGSKNMKGRLGQKRGSGREGGEQGKQANGGKGENENKNGNKNGKPGDGLGGGVGQGSRPYREIADPGFKAEKTPGKMQAGAISGLSHFRGQGAKGDAPLEFKQAFSAAEQDAQSAVERERVPADARETVMNYFLNVREGANLPAPPQPGKAAPEKSAPPKAPEEKKKAPATETLKE